METRKRTPTGRNQWIISWIVGRSKIQINTVITVTNNAKKSLFSLSVYGMRRKEALVVLTSFSRLMAKKIEEPLSHIRGWVNGRIVIAIARLYYRIICGVNLPSPLRDQ